MKMKNKYILISMLLGLIILTATSFALIEKIEKKNSGYIEIDIIKVDDNGFLFFSNDSCTGIIARTSIERAEAIESGKEGEIDFRPNTHEIFSETLKHFNISLKKVIINKIENNTYFSNMILTHNNRILELDARPSDAIAIALRTNSSILMNKSLFEKRKEEIC